MAAPHHYLDFERPIAELEEKIEELSRLAETGGEGETMGGDLDALRERVVEMRREAYSDLNAWRKTQVARHPDRPHFTDYLKGLIESFVELRGDRKFSDDQAIVGGLGRFRGTPVLAIGHEKGHDTTTRVRHNFGLAKPEGYRKAVRLMDLAERFSLPVLSFVDTGGAYPGREGEERGQGEAVARATERCLTLGVPMIATIIGEGGSGGALGIAAANRVLILEHATYSVITPEAGSSILFRDRAQAAHMAQSMKITAQDLIGYGIVDRIIPEPLGGAHAGREAMVQTVGDVVEEELRALQPLDANALRRQRADRFYAIGRPG